MSVEYKCKDCPNSETTRQWVSCKKLKGYIAPIGTIITDCPFREDEKTSNET